MNMFSCSPVRLAYQPPANSTFSQNKPATSNQPAVLFSQNKPALAISHQPTEQAAFAKECCHTITLNISTYEFHLKILFELSSSTHEVSLSLYYLYICTLLRIEGRT
jgi:hypothetical protein